MISTALISQFIKCDRAQRYLQNNTLNKNDSLIKYYQDLMAILGQIMSKFGHIC